MNGEIKEVSPAVIDEMQAKEKMTAEEWWTHHVELLMVKMRQSGVKSVHIELKRPGTYVFEIVPEDGSGGN